MRLNRILYRLLLLHFVEQLVPHDRRLGAYMFSKPWRWLKYIVVDAKQSCKAMFLGDVLILHLPPNPGGGANPGGNAWPIGGAPGGANPGGG